MLSGDVQVVGWQIYVFRKGTAGSFLSFHAKLSEACVTQSPGTHCDCVRTKSSYLLRRNEVILCFMWMILTSINHSIELHRHADAACAVGGEV